MARQTHLFQAMRGEGFAYLLVVQILLPSSLAVRE